MSKFAYQSHVWTEVCARLDSWFTFVSGASRDIGEAIAKLLDRQGAHVSVGIRCNALLPGLTNTRFASALVKNEAILNTAVQQIPIKRVAAPSEMAGAVLYLASNVSSYTTAVSLNMEGGFLS